jgi:hypothetical protein
MYSVITFQEWTAAEGGQIEATTFKKIRHYGQGAINFSVFRHIHKIAKSSS